MAQTRLRCSVAFAEGRKWFSQAEVDAGAYFQIEKKREREREREIHARILPLNRSASSAA